MLTVVTIIAMDKEGKDFAAENGFVLSEKTLLNHKIPAEIFEKVDGACTQILIISGKCRLHGVNRIGPSINLLAMAALEAFKPAYLVNAGFAGGFEKRGAAIGDVYMGNEAIFNHDRLFTDDDAYKAYCEGGFPAYYSEELAAAIGAKKGQVTSSGSMGASDTERAAMERLGTVVKDMEALAIAEVAYMMDTPFIPIKVITDCVDHPLCSQAQFNANYPRLVKNLHHAMLQTFNFFTAKHAASLSPFKDTGVGAAVAKPDVHESDDDDELGKSLVA